MFWDFFPIRAIFELTAKKLYFYLRRSRQVLELWEMLLLLLRGGRSLSEYNLAASLLYTVFRLHKFPSGLDP